MVVIPVITTAIVVVAATMGIMVGAVTTMGYPLLRRTLVSYKEHVPPSHYHEVTRVTTAHSKPSTSNLTTTQHSGAVVPWEVMAVTAGVRGMAVTETMEVVLEVHSPTLTALFVTYNPLTNHQRYHHHLKRC